MDDAPPSRVRPQISPEALPRADIIVGSRTVSVTLPLPTVDGRDLQVEVEKRAVHIWGRDAAAINYLVPLPVPVRAAGWKVAAVNGVVDIELERVRMPLRRREDPPGEV